ncbi:MAG: hypothetical protein FJ362_06105 [Gemmatimonadetes bacterium]|nr:hypothetical protein [Gemmatimonadota bacterium]
MSHHIFARRLRPLMVLAALTLGLGACKDSTGPDDHGHAEEVHAMRITLANGTSVTVGETGTVTGTLTIPRGVATAFTVTFLDDDGVVVDDLKATEFQASVSPNAGITFVRTGAFTGTLQGATAGTVIVRFGLFHVPHSHHDFGPFPVPVTIAGAA